MPALFLLAAFSAGLLGATTIDGGFHDAQTISSLMRFASGILVGDLCRSRFTASFGRSRSGNPDCLVLAGSRPEATPLAFRRRTASFRPLPLDSRSFYHSIECCRCQNYLAIEPSGRAGVRSHAPSH